MKFNNRVSDKRDDQTGRKELNWRSRSRPRRLVQPIDFGANRTEKKNKGEMNRIISGGRPLW